MQLALSFRLTSIRVGNLRGRGTNLSKRRQPPIFPRKLQEKAE